MDDQNKSEEEKKKKEEEHELRIDPVCGAGVIRVPKKKDDKNQFSDYG